MSMPLANCETLGKERRQHISDEYLVFPLTISLTLTTARCDTEYNSRCVDIVHDCTELLLE